MLGRRVTGAAIRMGETEGAAAAGALGTENTEVFPKNPKNPKLDSKKL